MAVRHHGPMAKKRKQRIRSPHPGVVLIPPRKDRVAWRARCDNPDTGGEEYVWLDPAVEGRTEGTRRGWAQSRSEDIEKRRP